MEVFVIHSGNFDLTHQSNLMKLPATEFDRVYHLAAWTKAGDFCLHHKGEQWIVNQLINTNALWYWRKYQPQAVLIAMGTSCAYPSDRPLCEDNYMVGDPDPDLYTYAMTKRMLCQGLRALHEQFDMNYQYFVPSTLYGPNFDHSDSHFIFDLIKKIVAGKEGHEPVVLWGDGSQVRELIYIDDAIRLIDIASETTVNEILNLGSGIAYSICEYAELICKIVGYDASEIQYDVNRYTGVPSKVFDTTKIHDLLDFTFTPIQEGLAPTIDYYLRTRTTSG